MAIEQSTMKIETLMEKGYTQYLDGRYQDAEQTYKKGILVIEEENLFQHAMTARLFFLLGELYFETSDIAQADIFYRHSLAVLEGLPSQNEVEICVVLRSLSETCRLQKKIRQAAKLSIRATNLMVSTKSMLENAFKLPSPNQ